MLTDMEIYNCKELTPFDEYIGGTARTPNAECGLQPKIKGDVLLENWNDFIDGKSGDKFRYCTWATTNWTATPNTTI